MELVDAVTTLINFFTFHRRTIVKVLKNSLQLVCLKNVYDTFLAFLIKNFQKIVLSASLDEQTLKMFLPV